MAEKKLKPKDLGTGAAAKAGEMMINRHKQNAAVYQELFGKPKAAPKKKKK